MKKARTTFRRVLSALFSVIITLLGYQMAYSQEDEYGIPSAEFIISGKVTDSITHKPISGIKVTVSSDQAYTDAKGGYRVALHSYRGWDSVYLIQFHDVDSTQNGSYFDLSTQVSTLEKVNDTHPQYPDGDIQKVFNVALKPKDE